MNHLETLFQKYYTQTATEQEREELLQWISTNGGSELNEWISAAWNKLEKPDAEFAEADKSILRKILAAAPAKQNIEEPAAVIEFDNPRSRSALTWFKYAAAILLIIGLGTYLWNNKPKPPSEAATAKMEKKNDIAPGNNKAILTLSDGKTIELGSATSETIKDGALSIENNNGQLIYKKGDMVAMNTMSTPRGGQYQLTLADGTKVWLNAASSIIYPTAFTGKTRTVSITGEAYFEVTQNKSQPFIVHLSPAVREKPGRDLSPAGGSGGALRDRELNKDRRDDEGGLDITVLGTSFNINAYPDEPAFKTSLIEGSVLISPAGVSMLAKRGGGRILKPGEAFTNNKIIKTNIAQDIAWKNGAFNFADMDLQTALRQISRWYNIDIRFEGKVPQKKLRGKMGRDLTLAQLLESFKGFGINTRLENNILILSEK